MTQWEFLPVSQHRLLGLKTMQEMTLTPTLSPTLRQGTTLSPEGTLSPTLSPEGTLSPTLSPTLWADRENKGADALSRSPILPPPEVGTVDGEVQVVYISHKPQVAPQSSGHTRKMISSKHMAEETIVSSPDSSQTLETTKALVPINIQNPVGINGTVFR